MTPVLTDLMGVDFTEGDRVVYASVNGIRVGKVDWIKELPSSSGKRYKVYIDMSEHHDKTGAAKMVAKRIGYRYIREGNFQTYHYFLKV